MSHPQLKARRRYLCTDRGTHKSYKNLSYVRKSAKFFVVSVVSRLFEGHVLM